MTRFIIKSLKASNFARFLIVGLINTLVGYSIFALLLYSGIHYAIASFVATILGVLFNFKTIGTIVFRNKSNSLIIRFITVYTLTYFLNIGCLKIFDLFAVNLYVAGLVLIMPMAITTFFLNKHFVFNATSS